jgi:hypothetical protein
MSFKYGYMAHRSAFSLTPSERQESFQRKKREQYLPHNAAHSRFTEIFGQSRRALKC